MYVLKENYNIATYKVHDVRTKSQKTYTLTSILFKPGIVQEKCCSHLAIETRLFELLLKVINRVLKEYNDVGNKSKMIFIITFFFLWFPNVSCVGKSVKDAD